MWLVGSCFTHQGLRTQHWECWPNHWTTSKFPAVTSLSLNYTLDASNAFQYVFKIFIHSKHFLIFLVTSFCLIGLGVCLTGMFVNPPDFFLLPISHFIVVREHPSYIFFLLFLFNCIFILLTKEGKNLFGFMVCLPCIWLSKVLYSKL